MRKGAPARRVDPRRRFDDIPFIRLAAALIALAAHHGRVHHHHVRLGPVESHRATYYSVPPCDKQGETTASGERVHFGVIASEYIPLHTKLRLTRPLFGRRDFEVLDTGAAFDVWLPCGPMTRGWENPVLSFQRVHG